ncbi:hypothetical protein B0T26DRAFT_658008 [Lasiosphaeria miniovina]|uniref:Uncharacterized protein n=1 Tax=Lasiosphaeria miniovina TaxID=1954250 RepID=A0AA40DKY9_9PEZI|nr:uncharacterized protein B0T26DRAFT_658008 [Lasiosphaeria miniovina]KAK0703668.1 hypothetical protein B0T26DRAFT_658008 [Lasiosphaeria miniovina]
MWGTMAAITDVYKATLKVAYPATEGITDELKAVIPDYITKAKKRVDDLIFVIKGLRWESEQARVIIVQANDKLHAILHEDFNDEPSEWQKDEEDEIPTSEPTR